tara:strand:+ start:492 stop:740 length:249 start_codon:yes stop_codon:yes gene_type:complete
MEPSEIVDLVGTDAPSSEVSDAIKQALLVKSAARVDAMTPNVAAGLFGDQPEEPEVEAEEPVAQTETEVDASIDQETEQEEE